MFVCFFHHYAWLFTSFSSWGVLVTYFIYNLIFIHLSHVWVGPGYSLHFFSYGTTILHPWSSMETTPWIESFNTLRFAFDKYLALLLELCPTDLNRLLGTQSQSEVRFWLERWKWRGSVSQGGSHGGSLEFGIFNIPRFKFNVNWIMAIYNIMVILW